METAVAEAATSKDVLVNLNYQGDIVGTPRYDIRDMASGKFENSNICWTPHEVTILDARPYANP